MAGQQALCCLPCLCSALMCWGVSSGGAGGRGRVGWGKLEARHWSLAVQPPHPLCRPMQVRVPQLVHRGVSRRAACLGGHAFGHVPGRGLNSLAARPRSRDRHRKYPPPTTPPSPLPGTALTSQSTSASFPSSACPRRRRLTASARARRCRAWTAELGRWARSAVTGEGLTRLWRGGVGGGACTGGAMSAYNSSPRQCDNHSWA
jgi:hypothetical protein